MLVEAVFNTGLHTVGVIGAIVWSLFTTARVLLWAFLVATAWFEIIEQPFHDEQIRAKRAKGAAPSAVELTATTLHQHNAAEAVYTLEQQQEQLQEQPPVTAQRWPTNIPRMSGVSEMDDDESVDNWSIWEGENQHQQQQQNRQENGRLTPDGFHAEPIPPINRARQPAIGVINGQRPADPEEAQILSALNTGTNTDLLKESEKEVIRHHPVSGKKNGEKKPFFSRKVEKWFVAPYAQKYERVGYFMYKGFNKVGLRLETSVNGLSTTLDGSIRQAGVEAVNRVEVVMRRYLKFFGAVMLLTVILVPLPSLHLSVGVA